MYDVNATDSVVTLLRQSSGIIHWDSCLSDWTLGKGVLPCVQKLQHLGVDESSIAALIPLVHMVSLTVSATGCIAECSTDNVHAI